MKTIQRCWYKPKISHFITKTYQLIWIMICWFIFLLIYLMEVIWIVKITLQMLGYLIMSIVIVMPISPQDGSSSSRLNSTFLTKKSTSLKTRNACIKMRNEFRKCQGTKNKLLKIATYKIQWRDNIGQTPGVVTAVPKRGTTVTEASTPHLLEEMESIPMMEFSFYKLETCQKSPSKNHPLDGVIEILAIIFTN